MHNPFVLHSEKLLQALIASGHCYFVRQTFTRGKDELLDKDVKGSFLISHYNDQNKAKVHFEAVAGDPYKLIYDISIPAQKDKLLIGVRQPEGYRIYAPLLQKEWTPSDKMAEKIKRYLENRLQWKPDRSTTVNANLFIQFGEVFITLKFQSQETKIPLADIEKI
jgi:CRISPR/Cas system-associated protein Cas10 (large subunit of type III CRISPR-Cas system)